MIVIFRFLAIIVFYIGLSACYSQLEGFNSKKLTSSKGEVVYINSVNYGMTGDMQISLITLDKNKLKYKIDTNGVVYGLNPFIYSFQNDTLKLFFNDTITYNVEENFETIKVVYSKVSNPEYMVYIQKAINLDSFHTVPEIGPKTIQSIPKPPSKE